MVLVLPVTVLLCLIMALDMPVDDGIVSVENIFRHHPALQAGRSERSPLRGRRDFDHLISKIRLEIEVNGDFVEPIIQASLKGTGMKEVGYGKIFAYDPAQRIRIRYQWTRKCGDSLNL